MRNLTLLRNTYIQPKIVEEYKISEWNQLIKEAYATGLLARLYYLFKRNDLLKYIPEKQRWHFKSAFKRACAHQEDIKLEVEHVINAVSMSGKQPTFLKGTAYLLAEDEASFGRIFSDIDIFVNKNDLPAVERFLHWQGWSQGEVDQYDVQYYRNWMHEIPALTHIVRGSTLDVHHNLLPKISKINIEAQKIEDNIDNELRVLAPEDRVIHSIVHLFLENEFDKAMRDMTDIDMLLVQHQREDSNFIEKVSDRAINLRVELLVYYAFRYLNIHLNTAINDEISDKFKNCIPSKFKLKVMDKIFGKVLFSPLSLDRSFYNRFCHFLAFVRGHWIRMPFHVLVPHLLHKAFITPYHVWKKDNKA